jgi:hypothetical protein
MSINGAAGTYTVMSGIKFHGMAAADYCLVTIAGTSGANAYVTKDSEANTISITTAASGTVDLICMVGLSDYSLESIACRGNTGARQMLP